MSQSKISSIRTPAPNSFIDYLEENNLVICKKKNPLPNLLCEEGVENWIYEEVDIEEIVYDCLIKQLNKEEKSEESL